MTQQYVIEYQEHEMMGGILAMQARRMHLTPEQLIRRILARELGDIGMPTSRLTRETDRTAFWANNGALAPCVAQSQETAHAAC